MSAAGWVLAVDDDPRDMGEPATWHSELGDRIVFASQGEAESSALHAFGDDALDWLAALPVDETPYTDGEGRVLESPTGRDRDPQ